MFITDLHNHIVPNIDDGSDSFEMSLEMIRMLYNQGVIIVSVNSVIDIRSMKAMIFGDSMNRKKFGEKQEKKD